MSGAAPLVAPVGRVTKPRMPTRRDRREHCDRELFRLPFSPQAKRSGNLDPRDHRRDRFDDRLGRDTEAVPRAARSDHREAGCVGLIILARCERDGQHGRQHALRVIENVPGHDADWWSPISHSASVSRSRARRADRSIRRPAHDVGSLAVSPSRRSSGYGVAVSVLVRPAPCKDSQEVLVP